MYQFQVHKWVNDSYLLRVKILKIELKNQLYQWSIALLSKLAVKDWGRVRFDVDEGDGFVAPVTQTKYFLG